MKHFVKVRLLVIRFPIFSDFHAVADDGVTVQAITDLGVENVAEFLRDATNAIEEPDSTTFSGDLTQ